MGIPCKADLIPFLTPSHRPQFAPLSICAIIKESNAPFSLTFISKA
jgi:hypothetical protein